MLRDAPGRDSQASRVDMHKEEGVLSLHHRNEPNTYLPSARINRSRIPAARARSFISTARRLVPGVPDRPVVQADDRNKFLRGFRGPEQARRMIQKHLLPGSGHPFSGIAS